MLPFRIEREGNLERCEDPPESYHHDSSGLGWWFDALFKTRYHHFSQLLLGGQTFAHVLDTVAEYIWSCSLYLKLSIFLRLNVSSLKGSTRPQRCDHHLAFLSHFHWHWWSSYSNLLQQLPVVFCSYFICFQCYLLLSSTLLIFIPSFYLSQKNKEYLPQESLAWIHQI